MKTQGFSIKKFGDDDIIEVSYSFGGLKGASYLGNVTTADKVRILKLSWFSVNWKIGTLALATQSNDRFG